MLDFLLKYATILTLSKAGYNARAAGVDGRIEFLCCDYQDVVGTARFDTIFFSPPWGGPLYDGKPYFQLSQEQVGSLLGTEMLKRSFLTTKDVICFLPRNTDVIDAANTCGTICKVSTLSNYPTVSSTPTRLSRTVIEKQTVSKQSRFIFHRIGLHTHRSSCAPSHSIYILNCTLKINPNS